MPELYRSAYQAIEYLPKYSLIKQVLTGKTKDMTWDQYQKELLSFSEIVKLHKPHKILVNATEFQFLIMKDMQDWIDRNLIASFNQVGLQKWAVIIPPQFLVQVSIEKTMAINPSNTFEAQYFENEQEAMQWLSNTENHN
jgi:phage pi2 protein 07